MELPSKEIIDSHVEQLHASRWKLYLATTGACGGLLEHLWRVPGSSATLIGQRFLYRREEFDDFAAFRPSSYCSQHAAAALAGAAHSRARQIVIEAGERGDYVVGVGMTASVSTGREKRGAHRVHIAAKNDRQFFSIDAEFEKGRFTREEEGRLCDFLTLCIILYGSYRGCMTIPELAGVICEQFTPCDAGKVKVMPSHVEGLDPADIDAGLFRKEGGFLFSPEGWLTLSPKLDPSKHILFPGSFDPLHSAHEKAADMVERMTGRRVVFQFNGAHPDKGRLSVSEMMDRTEQFLWRWPIAYLPEAGLYVEKANRFPGVSMLIGADVVYGILNPKYYGGEGELDLAMQRLMQLGTKFFVTGREVRDRGFQTLDDIPIPNKYRQLFLPVAGRWDMSSTELRKRI